MLTMPDLDRKRRAKLFRNGRNQAVRIPRAFELPGNEVFIRKEGRRLIIEPVEKGSLLELLETLQSLKEDFRRVGEVVTKPLPPQTRACGLPHSVPLMAGSLSQRESVA